LFPSPWPADRSPLTTSSLLSVSSIKGLLAAAGPDTLVVASTDTLRKTFASPTDDGNVKNLTPELSIPIPRLSHVAFTSDGACLIIAAEQGGGLAIHSVENLLKNITTPVIELPTEGVAIQALVPNPAEDLAHLVAVVMTNGHLMIANLQERAFARGVNNVPSLKDGVRSVAWSLRGKQLVVGLQDGAAMQLEPTGAPKAVIRRPPGVDSNLEGSIVPLDCSARPANYFSINHHLA
jgi:nucleoporin NUP159